MEFLAGQNDVTKKKCQQIEKLMERTESEKKDFSQRATLAKIKNAIKIGGKR